MTLPNTFTDKNTSLNHGPTHICRRGRSWSMATRCDIW